MLGGRTLQLAATMRVRAGRAGRAPRPPSILSNVDAFLANHAPVNDGRRRLIIRRGNTEQALDTTDDATDRGANDCADRTGNAVAFTCTTREAAGNTLRLRR